MKKYTLTSTIREIFEDRDINPCLRIIFSDTLLQFIPDEAMDEPIMEVEKKYVMPWGAHFPADQLLHAVELAQSLFYTDNYEIMPLWMDNCDDYIPDASKPDHTGVFLVKRKLPVEEKRPAVVVCPGGSYEMHAFDNEGLDLANKLDDMGFTSFVLRYRVAPNRYPLEQYDLMLAIKYVRANAERLGVDEKFVMAMGSSAGGHLCASTGLLSEKLEAGLTDEMHAKGLKNADLYSSKSGRPDALCLNYPVITFLEEQHEPSFQALTGGDESLREYLSVEKHISPGYPKTFIWACEDDNLVPYTNTVKLGEALKAAGVEHECTIYPQGGHGCGLAYGTSAEGWIERMRDYILTE